MSEYTITDEQMSKILCCACKMNEDIEYTYEVEPGYESRDYRMIRMILENVIGEGRVIE